MTAGPTTASAPRTPQQRYQRFLLLIAGLGGLLYGVDVGIIGGALPYLAATSGLDAGQLSIIVAAVLLGSVFSTLVAGVLADWMGRRRLMTWSGLAFALSVPIIALSHGFAPLFLGRLLQGTSGGLIGVVVPLYLAECLVASGRGKGTGAFQWLLTLGILAAALIGIYYSYRVEAVANTAGPAALFAFKDQAWRRIFWVSLPPSVLFVLGSLFITESPRWLFQKGKRGLAHAALLRSRTAEQAAIELDEMERSSLTAHNTPHPEKCPRETLLQRRYIVPFLLACAVLFFNQATGINSIIGYNTNVLLQSGLSDVGAHWGYVVFTLVNFLLTMLGMALVDRTGRRGLLLTGAGGAALSLAMTGALFLQAQHSQLDCSRAVQSMIMPGQSLDLSFNPDTAAQILAAMGGPGKKIHADRASLVIIYSYGDFTGTTNTVRSDGPTGATLRITRSNSVPANKVTAFFQGPFANLDAARKAPLKVRRAVLGNVPGRLHGWLVALSLDAYVACYAFGPGVCVWLALSELMPTRIRSNGMSIALVLNQMLSTTLAAAFLPVAGRYGYATVFFSFAGFTVLYLLIVALFLPETKGKTLEEIEEHFVGAKA